MKAPVAALAALLLAVPSFALAQSWKPVQKCPSKWGASDERGSANHMKPESVLRATRLIKTGEVIEIGHVLGADDALLRHPAFRRAYQAHLHEPALEPARQQRGARRERDRPGGHAVRRLRAPDPRGLDVQLLQGHARPATRGGFTKLGVEKVGTLMTRGVLIDVAALKGVDILPDAYEITVADLEQAMARQNVSIQPGDAVLIHTGWGKLWAKDNARYVKSCPGVGVAAAEWLVEEGPDAGRRGQLAGGGLAESGLAT